MFYPLNDELHLLVRQLVPGQASNHFAEVVVAELVVTVKICKKIGFLGQFRGKHSIFRVLHFMYFSSVFSKKNEKS